MRVGLVPAQELRAAQREEGVPSAPPVSSPRMNSAGVERSAPAVLSGEGPRCAHCGKLIELSAMAHKSALAKRKYCSHGCSVKASRVEKGIATAQRHCAHCHKPLVKRDDEKLSRYLVRRFCGQPCKIAGQIRAAPRYATVEEWLAHNEVTRCPTAYLAPVVNQRIGGMRDGRVR